MSLQGDESPRGRGLRCPAQGGRSQQPQNDSSYQGGDTSPSNNHPRQIHGHAPQLGHDTSSTPSQENELPGPINSSRTDHSVKRDGDSPSQSGDGPFLDATVVFNRWSWHRLPQIPEQSRSHENTNLVDAESPASELHEPTSEPIQACAAVSELEEIEKDLEMLQQKLEQNMAQQSAILAELTTTRAKLQDHLKQKVQRLPENVVTRAHSHEPINSIPTDPAVKKPAVEKPADRKSAIDSRLEDIEPMVGPSAFAISDGLRDLFRSFLASLKGAAGPTEAITHRFGLTANDDQASTDRSEHAGTTRQASRAGTKTAPEQDGIDPRAFSEYISSRKGDPTFACTFMLCHYRSNSSEDFHRHLERDHQDLLQGSGVPRLHNQLNAAALEVFFGGSIPPFARNYMDGIFRTALLSSRRGPMTISRAREENERSAVTIDTFGIPFTGQNQTGRL